MELLQNIFASSVHLMAPYLFGALGAIFSVRSGVTNIAIEGMMLTGAYAGFYGSATTGSPLIGIIYALIAGGLVGSVLAFLSVSVGTNQIVAGTAINLVALGLTSFLYSLSFDGSTVNRATSLPVICIPGLSKLPIIGVMFNNSALTYLCFLLIPITWWFFYKTSWGLNIRAVGENPAAADSLGINVHRTRYIGIITSGMICALGGAYLTLELSPVFTENISSGKGYIALAALVLGRRHPIGVLGSAFLFGVAEAIQVRMQTYQMLNIPVEFLQMLPYVAAVLVMLIPAKKDSAPAGIGKAYFKE